MAKYTINHACGHSSTQQLFGKGSERERKIAWWETVDCPECYKKSLKEARETEKKAANKKASEYLQSHKLPDLTGSEKQISWANTIRTEIIADAEKYQEAILKVADDEEATKLSQKYIIIFIDDLKNQTSAKWWIDHRNQSRDQILSGGNVGDMFGLVLSGATPKNSALTLWQEWIAKQPEVIEYRERMRKEKERKVAEYESAKQAHIDNVLSCLDRVDWEKEIVEDTDYTITGDGHKVVLNLSNGDHVVVYSIDGKTEIDFDGKFACWIEMQPKVKELNKKLTDIYKSINTIRLQTFIDL